jgi:hypothetical protein
MFFALTSGHDGADLDTVEPQRMAETILAGA